MSLSLRPATESTLPNVRALFREYAEALGVDLGFQGFEQELATLPRPYDAIVLAETEGRLAGCAAIKPLGPHVCELKRLYVRPGFRRLGVGRALVEATVDEARARGYRGMRLDTLARLESAVALYRSLGFEEISPYYDNSLPERVLYFERPLE